MPTNYDKKKPPFLFTDDESSSMNLHFTFSVREVSKVVDGDQTLQIPMYFTVSWIDDRLSVEHQHRAWQKSTTGEIKWRQCLKFKFIDDCLPLLISSERIREVVPLGA